MNSYKQPNGTTSEAIHRIEISSDPKTSPDLLETLAQNSVSAVRQGVAANPSTPVHVLTLLADDFDIVVKRSLVDNPNITPEILAYLAENGNRVIEKFIAAHPRCPQETLALLASHTDDDVALALVNRDDATPDLLCEVAAHARDSEVLWRLVRHTHAPSELFETIVNMQHVPEVVKAHAAKHHLLSETTLRQLSISPVSHLRRAVAANHSTPPDVLAALINDASDGIKSAVAENPRTEPETLHKLVESSGPPPLDESIARHARTASHTLTALYKRYYDKEETRMSPRAKEIVYQIMSHANAEPVMLSSAVVSVDVKLRRHIAANHRTPMRTLTLLAMADDASVSEAAASTLQRVYQAPVPRVEGI